MRITPVRLVLIVFLLAAFVGAQSPPPIPSGSKRDKGEENHVNAHKTQANPSNDSAKLGLTGVPEPIADIPQYAPNNHSSERAADTSPKWTEVVNAFSTVVMVVVTLGIGIVNFSQWRVSGKAADAAEKALRLDIALRRHNSIIAIADLIDREAAEWATRKFRADTNQVNWHNESIDRISPYLEYLEHHHQDKYRQVADYWREYHGGDCGAPISISAYCTPDRQKFHWIEKLFRISDTLRASIA